MKRFLKIFLIICFLTACSDDVHKTVIQTQNAQVVYWLEIADTPEKQAKGLMYRSKLASDKGMLFLFDDTHHQPIAMWMKNTYIPLDMLFLSKDKTIIAIYENAIPLSLKIISPTQEFVSAVIELNAGQIKKHGIKIGDKVLY